MVKIKKHLVSKSVAKDVTYNGKNSKKYIVIHETANTSKGANADAHARLQANGNSRQASWHYQVDDKEIIQSFGDDTQCWHAGNRKYNEQSIGVEICVNSDGDFKKAVDNAVKLTKHLMDKYNINANNVIQHNQASGKNCPRYLRSGEKGVTWSQFKAKLSDKTSSNTKPTKSNNSATNAQKSTYKGNSIVDYLKSIGIDSSFSNRKKLAKKYGIKNYTGTAKQNIQLLNAMRGKPKPEPKPKKSISQMADEIIQGKYGSGHENRRKSLGIDKATYKKVRAKVNEKLGAKTSNKSSGSTKKTSSKSIKKGDKVTLSKSAKKYATGEKIPAKYKGKTYTVQQVKSDRVLLKELYSWVNKKDVGGCNSSKNTLKKGQTVTLKKSAKKFATGETIASFAKGKKYKVLQVKSDRVLLDEIMSWVNKSDVE